MDQNLEWNNCGTRRCSRKFKDSVKSEESWKLSSSCSRPYARKSLPQEPCFNELSKKTKPLPCVPESYGEHQQYYDHYMSSVIYCYPSSLNNNDLTILSINNNQQKESIDFLEQNTSPIKDYYSSQLSDNQLQSSLIEEQTAQSYYSPSSVINDLTFGEEKLIETKKEGGAHDSLLIEEEEKSRNKSNTRQFTIRSISDNYKVWITVEPKETGESIARKIHAIATFRSKKILTVTTASGRKIALNKTPIFKDWEDINDFEDGETWSFTCGPLRKSIIDKFLSKLIQV